MSRLPPDSASSRSLARASSVAAGRFAVVAASRNLLISSVGRNSRGRLKPAARAQATRGRCTDGDSGAILESDMPLAIAAVDGLDRRCCGPVPPP